MGKRALEVLDSLPRLSARVFRDLSTRVELSLGLEVLGLLWEGRDERSSGV